MKNNYNPEYPLDNIKVREIPSVIRNKGEQIINYFKDIENSRVTNSFSNISELINFLFITNNIDLNSGIYIKNDNYWIGVSTIDELPTNIEKEKDLRLTINSNSYSLKNINENYVFALSNNINPFCYYDLFNLNGNITNDGFGGKNYGLFIENIERNQDLTIPLLKSNNISKTRIQSSFYFDNTFSFSVLFYGINRRYENGTIIDSDILSTLLFIKDKFNVVRLGLCYDKSNKLFLTNKDEKIDLNYILSDDSHYQIAFVHINSKLNIIINSELIFTYNINLLNDKELYFSICEDNDYGHYANASAHFGEINVFNIQITPEENLMLRDNPRRWNISSKKDTYLDLTFEEKLKLKEFVNKIKLPE